MISNLRKGWQIQRRNLHALMVRDLMMRYGRENIGFVWVILEPMILTVGVMVVWSSMSSSKSGMKVVEIVLTGYMPLTLWRHMTNNVVNIFRNSAGLLYHRRISLIDMLASRLLLEFVGTSAALLVVYVTLSTIGVVQEIARIDLLLLGWFMMAWIALATGACLAVFTEKYEVAERFVQPIQYLIIPICGAFFMVDWMPEWAQRLLLLNPLVHCYEVFRGGYFGESVVVHYDVLYFSTCSFVLSFFGLVGIGRARKFVRLQ